MRLVKREEDLIHNLWELMNPHKQILIDNALIYDVLIHLIFDLNACATQ